MPFLTVASIPMRALVQGARRGAPTRLGESVRAFDGTLRSTVRGEKRNWTVTVFPKTAADATALRAAIAGGAFVTCGGDALGADTTCEVRETGAEFVKVGAAAPPRERITLEIQEV